MIDTAIRIILLLKNFEFLFSLIYVVSIFPLLIVEYKRVT